MTFFISGYGVWATPGINQAMYKLIRNGHTGAQTAKILSRQFDLTPPLTRCQVIGRAWRNGIEFARTQGGRLRAKAEAA